MFRRKVKDSIKLRKDMDNSEKQIETTRKSALWLLFLQTLLMMALIIIQIMSLDGSVDKYSVLAVLAIITVILINSFFGFHTIFYLDQTKIGGYKFINIISHLALGTAVVLQQIFKPTLDNSDIDPSSTSLEVAALSLTTLTLILDITQILLLNKITLKFRRHSERGHLRTAMFDKSSYDSILQSSLLIKSDDV